MIERFASEENNIDITIIHADALTLNKNSIEENKDRQIAIYNNLSLRFKKAGDNSVAITSIPVHFFIEKFKKKPTLP